MRVIMQNNKQLNDENKINITPETKVGELLKNYPELEESLIEMAPAFNKLRNPILRKTVAKVTTLRHAAKIGNISLADMINRLRREAGLEGEMKFIEENRLLDDKPEWMDISKIVKTLDAREMIEKGEHPINQVIKELDCLESRQIFELITGFIPAPLIDIAKNKGFLIWSEEKEKNLVKTYFIKLK